MKKFFQETHIVPALMIPASYSLYYSFFVATKH